MQKKNTRMLHIFFRGLRGEQLSVKKLAEEFEVSSKSITRDLNELKNYLADHRDIVGNTEWQYSYKTKTYQLSMDGFLESKELFAVVEILLSSRALSHSEMVGILEKIRMFTTANDRALLRKMVDKELYHYQGVKSECGQKLDHLWDLAKMIEARKEITIEYYKMDRSQISRRILPVAIVCSEYYFYLIAYHKNEDKYLLRYYRVDRIVSIIEHRAVYELKRPLEIDEGELKKKIQFMWPGEHQRIKFEFRGPSVQAILDRIPTARAVCKEGNTWLIEAEVYGDGISMYLLSQGAWVTVLEPESLREKMKEQARKMLEQYI